MSNVESKKKERMEQVAKRRFFYAQSFEAYGGVSGFFDYGPYMCGLQNNFISIWRRHFVLEEGMHEVDAAIITPFEVLKSSGHVDKFTDLMCSDAKTGEIYRADHLVKEWLLEEAEKRAPEEKQKMEDEASMIDSFSLEELQKMVDTYGITSKSGNKLEKLVHFNLMFGTVVGPGGKAQSFLRPETAQGQFLNFKRLLEVNGERMPFASAMIGKAFRNEISPRTGLFRVREFTMAEIEHYVHPLEKDHPKFRIHSDLEIPLLFRAKDADNDAPQTLKKMTIGRAVEEKVVDNETLGYFIARVYLFLKKIGIPEEHIRIRQHLKSEMAHYATDCWDAEINTAFGWVECVGIADRACYDLSVHTNRTGNKLVVRRPLAQPVEREVAVPVVNKKQIGEKFRSKAQKIIEKLEKMTVEEIEEKAPNNEIEVQEDGEVARIPVERKKIVEYTEEYIPNVVEPSFGLGRILYALLWHSFWNREEDEQRAVFSFVPEMAPVKCTVLPLQEDERFSEVVRAVKEAVIREGLSCQVDASKASIGRRYSRSDEIGVPFCVTVDFDTLEDQCVTVRERDTTKQMRVKIAEVAGALRKLVNGETSFEGN